MNSSSSATVSPTPCWTLQVSPAAGGTQPAVLHSEENQAVIKSKIACAGVLGGEEMLQLLTQPLRAGAANGAELDWRTAEAALYCVRSISRYAHLRSPLTACEGCNLLSPLAISLSVVQPTHCMSVCCSKAPPPGDALLMQLFGSLPTLPSVPLLRYTACMTIASYSAWLAETAGTGAANQLMPQLLQMLTTGNDDFLAPCSACC